MTKDPDAVQQVKTEAGHVEHVTNEELEAASEWWDQMKKQAEDRPRCPLATALE